MYVIPESRWDSDESVVFLSLTLTLFNLLNGFKNVDPSQFQTLRSGPTKLSL